MDYFTRYFTTYFQVERYPAAGGVLAGGVSRQTKERFKKYFNWKPPVPAEAKPQVGEVGFRGFTPAALVKAPPEPFKIDLSWLQPVRELKIPKPKIVVKDTEREKRIAQRKAEAMRKAKKRREEEVFLMTIL